MTPLNAAGIERFMRALSAEVGSVGNARDGIDRVLPLVRRRRDPIPQTERENFRSTLSSSRRRSMASPIPSSTQFRMASPSGCISMRTIQTICWPRPSSSGPSNPGLGWRSCFRTCRAPEPAVFSGRSGVAFREFTCTALVYRLCQRLDERFDRSRHQRFVVFDVEATSTHIGTAELLQIGAVVVDNGRIAGEPFCRFVRPSGPGAISFEVTRLTGIGWPEVADAQGPAEVVQAFLDFAGDAPLVGHNIDGYDLPLLRRICQEHGLAEPARFTIDTMKVWKRLHPNERWDLDAALTRDEKRLRREHRADLDARLNARVFIDLMREIGRDRRSTLLTEELPLVAASIALQGRADIDNQLLQITGRRALALGQGLHPAQAADCLLLPGALALATPALDAIELVIDPDDAHWERIEQQWIDSVGIYERTHIDQSLQGFVRWFELAVSTDIEHVDANRVAMMSIHAAKGREWPVVIMLGAEDDQYVFPAEPDEEEARRISMSG